MKKCITFNINGTIYNIDVDAYDALQTYLNDLQEHFKGEEGSDEILEDIEFRIGELFSQRLRYGLTVITLRDTQEVISIMGDPAELGSSREQAETDNHNEEPHKDSQNKDDEENSKESASASKEFSQEGSTKQKRLYRDPDHAVLGGVAAGLAYYFNIDMALVRVFFIIFTIFGGASIWIYLILWLIVPEATNSAQKLEMKGETVNAENIRRMIVEEMEKAAANLKKQQPTITKIGNSFITVFKTILKIFGAVLGGCLGFIVVMIFLSLIFSLFTTWWITPFGFFHSFQNELIHLSPDNAIWLPFIFFSILSSLLFLYGLIRVIVGGIMGWAKQPAWLTVLLWTIWIFSAVSLLVLLFYTPINMYDSI